MASPTEWVPAILDYMNKAKWYILALISDYNITEIKGARFEVLVSSHAALDYTCKRGPAAIVAGLP